VLLRRVGMKGRGVRMEVRMPSLKGIWLSFTRLGVAILTLS
jgi:hypothetical protein